ncbi:MAG: type II CAAX endopeptidase family protein [Gimesia sp.]
MVLSSLIYIILLLALVSTRYWFLLFKAKSGTAIFPLNTDRRPLEMSFPVILVILWITLRLSMSLNVLWTKWQEIPVFTKPVSLNDVIGSSLTTFSFGVILIVMLALSNQKTMQKIGFRLNDKLGQLRDGSVGFLLALIPVIILLFITHSFRTEEVLHPLFILLKASPHFSTIFWIFISAVLVAPLFEELIYRVILQGWLEDVLPPFAAIFCSSLVFSFVHGFPDCIPLFPLAFILGTLFYYRRSFVSNVITHALFNAVNLTMALLNQQNPV